jgi:2-iminobutanoate/2-iminopropanoate deaminase
MDRNVIKTTYAPAAVGPYSQAIKTGDMVFVSGQIPLDPKTGEIVAGDVQDQTRQALNNLKAVLVASGASLSNVVKTTVFITDMGQFAAVNEIYSEFFAADPPARSCVQVGALPRGAEVEVEAIAVL